MNNYKITVEKIYYNNTYEDMQDVEKEIKTYNLKSTSWRLALNKCLKRDDSSQNPTRKEKKFKAKLLNVEEIVE